MNQNNQESIEKSLELLESIFDQIRVLRCSLRIAHENSQRPIEETDA